jgi:hypothetical protein
LTDPTSAGREAADWRKARQIWIGSPLYKDKRSA